MTKTSSPILSWRPLIPALIAGWMLPAQASDDLFFGDLPVVSSVSRLPQPQADAPGSVTVLDREMILASGARNLNDVFRLVPGFQTFVFNTDAPPRVTYHGISDENFSPRVQVLVDGRTQYSPLFQGGVNWSVMPVALEDIERIEVIRGSNSAAYGSNAFLGVINIITIDPSLAQGFSVSASNGNQGVEDYRLRTGGKLGEVGNFRFTYQQQRDTGLQDQYDWSDYFNSRMFDARANLVLNSTDELELFAGHAEGNYLTGRYEKGAKIPGTDRQIILPIASPCDPFYNLWQATSYIQALWSRSLASDADVQVRYSHTEDQASGNHTERCDNTKYNGNNNLLYRVDLIGDKSTQDELELQHTFSPFERTRLVWGLGTTYQTMRSATFFHGDPTIRRYINRGFGNLEWQPSEHLTLNLGGTAEADSLSKNTFAPRLNANFHLNSENTIRLGWSRAYRSANMVDLRGDRWKSPYATATGIAIPEDAVYVRRFYADPETEPEEITSVELGYLGEWKAQRMSLDVRLYNEKIPNRIGSWKRSYASAGICEISDNTAACKQLKKPGQDLFVDYSTNIQHVEMEGLEYQWRWQPFDRTRLMVNQAFHKIHARYLPDLNLNINDTNYLNNSLLHTNQSAPTRSTTIMLMQKLPYGMEFSAVQYWVGAMKWTRNTQVRPYQRLDLRLAYPFQLGSTRGELAYTIQNAFWDHGEYKASGFAPADRVVSERHWVSLKFDY